MLPASLKLLYSKLYVETVSSKDLEKLGFRSWRANYRSGIKSKSISCNMANILLKQWIIQMKILASR